jgi:hypothetical protein
MMVLSTRSIDSLPNTSPFIISNLLDNRLSQDILINKYILIHVSLLKESRLYSNILFMQYSRSI